MFSSGSFSIQISVEVFDPLGSNFVQVDNTGLILFYELKILSLLQCGHFSPLATIT